MEEDFDPGKFNFTFLYSTLPAMLNGADRLLALAETQDGRDQALLCACATLMLAAALDQGSTQKLQHAEGTLDLEDPELGHLQCAEDDTFWCRLEAFPRLITHGDYRLDRQNRYARTLRDLVTIRNNLMHIKEPPIVIRNPAAYRAQPVKGPSLHVKIQPRGGAPVEPFEFDYAVPEQPWFSVSLDQAKAFRDAVAVYARELLLGDPEDIEAGEIVCSGPP